MNDQFRVGVMGCADIAGRLVVPNMLQTGKFKLTAFASRSRDKALEFSKRFTCEAITGYDRLLERDDIDVIYIPLPTGLHYEWIVKSLQSGKHVLSEKSLTTDVHETKHIIELARNLHRCVFENFMFVHHSQFEFLQQRLDEGLIGEVRHLRSSFGIPVFKPESNIRYKKALGGGALFDTGAYTVMAVHCMLGRDQKVLASSLDTLGWEVDMQGSALLKNGSGIVSHISFGLDNFYQNTIELWGTKGRITLDRAFTSGPTHTPRAIIDIQDVRSEYTLPPDNHFQKILTVFHDCIRDGRNDFQFEQMLVQSELLTQIKTMAESER